MDGDFMLFHFDSIQVADFYNFVSSHYFGETGDFPPLVYVSLGQNLLRICHHGEERRSGDSRQLISVSFERTAYVA